MTMLGEALRPDMFERLRELESFREYEAKVEARAEAKADAAAKAKADAAAKLQLPKPSCVADAKAEAEAATIAGNLNEFLVLRGDAPSEACD